MEGPVVSKSGRVSSRVCGEGGEKEREGLRTDLHAVEVDIGAFGLVFTHYSWGDGAACLLMLEPCV